MSLSNRLFQFFTLFLLSINVSAQQTLQGTVKTVDNQPILKASIAYLHHPMGCYTDGNGKFSLQKITGDTIQISFVGYQSKSFLIHDTTGFLQATLVQEEYELEKVSVSLKKMKKVSLGYYSALSFFHDYRGPGTENSILIPNKDQLEGYIEVIKFKITNAENSPWNLRVRLRVMDTITGLPSGGLPVLEGDIPAALLKKVNNISIKEKNIVLPPSGVFVTLEWLHPDNIMQKTYAHHLVTPAIPGKKVSERKAYFQYTGSSKWQSEVSPEYPYSYFASNEGKNLYAPNISIIVSVPKN